MNQPEIGQRVRHIAIGIPGHESQSYFGTVAYIHSPDSQGRTAVGLNECNANGFTVAIAWLHHLKW